MLVKLFDIQNGKVIPSEHCYTIKSLKIIMDEYPDTFLSVYLYVFYMTCPDPDMNPFFSMAEHEKEELIIDEIKLEESPEDETIRNAVKLCEELYQTPTYRAYKGIKTMLDRLARYMETTQIEHGRDGNLTALVNTAAKFDSIRQSFKGAYNDMKDEQKSQVRGGQGLAYDQL
tara:strand:+ start:61 stop:579 length:519 start_codon:yes stop_codon:yes gene_type:complete